MLRVTMGTLKVRERTVLVRPLFISQPSQRVHWLTVKGLIFDRLEDGLPDRVVNTHVGHGDIAERKRSGVVDGRVGKHVTPRTPVGFPRGYLVPLSASNHQQR